MATNDPSTNYTWDLPNVSGDTGSWGALLNDILSKDVTGIDAILFAVSEVADAALPVDGSAPMAGHLDVQTSSSAGGVIASGSGTKTLDLAVANFWNQSGTMSGAVTFDIVNVQGASGEFEAIVLRLVNPGAASSITWKVEGGANNILWADGTAPTFTVSGTDVIVLFTYNGGTNWIGVQAVAGASA
jgi:hypothetical protein